MKKFFITRRRLLRTSVSSSVLFLAGCATTATQPMMGMNHGHMGAGAAKPMEMKAHPGRALNEAFVADVDIALRAIQTEVALLSGKATQVWRYEGQVLKGDNSTVTMLPNSSIGPIIRVRRGQKVRVRFSNQLPDKTALSVVHWHGLHLPEDMDGHPRIAIAPDSTYTYEFEVTDRAGTYWFHPHPHGDTARQVYRGLAGMFIVSDDEEQALKLPAGEFDVPLVLQDRTFDANNQLQYLGGGMMGGMMTQMMGFIGDKILVNGRPEAKLDVATRAYRLRVLNGSNARIYKLAWSDGSPLNVIGTDGGLLDKPLQRDYLMLSPGERAELFVDFSSRKIGDSMKLVSLAFEGVENVAVPPALKSQASGGMGQMMVESNALPQGQAFDVLVVKIARDDPQRGAYKLPAALSIVPRLKLSDAVNATKPRQFEIDHQMMNWRLNGKQWEGDVAAPNEQVKLNTTEVWEFVNKLNLGEMMDPMGMAHPIHIHGVHFQVIERVLTVSELQANYDTVRNGFVEEGLKDTFLLMPGERVKVLLHFKDFTGKFVYHCHNLQHEDQGLMRNYQVL